MKKETQSKINEENKEKKNRPTQYRIKNVVISEFTNTVKEIEYKTYRIQKIYKDEKDEWKTTESLGISELNTLYFLLGQLLNNELEITVNKPE